MPLNYSAAHSSRIKKRPAATNPLRRSSSSPFSSHARRKAISRTPSKPDSPSLSRSTSSKLPHNDHHHDDEDVDDESTSLLYNTRPTSSLTSTLYPLRKTLPPRTVLEAIHHIQQTMFTPVPDERSGMNSTRIAEILNYRLHLPPIVTIAHIHAVLDAPTATEREIAHLVQRGVLRKLRIPGRAGGGVGAIGEGVVLMSDWERCVRDAAAAANEEEEGLDDGIKEKYIHLLHTYPSSLTIPAALLSAREVHALMRAGFLTRTSNTSLLPAASSTRTAFAAPSAPTAISSSGSLAPSGTLGAIGGQNALLDSGGGGGGIGSTVSRSKRGSTSAANELLTPSLPSTGPYVRLLLTCRTQLLALLGRSKHSVAPLPLLRERWDGGVASDDKAASVGKRVRGEFAGLLPGRTRKWRAYWGVDFAWVVGECVGGGLVEVLDGAGLGSSGGIVRATGN
ncbi:MAG: hypothetical protein M1819_002289 [Sarea resinae]|nr:MAG: hypothetical protein M1819_002289 [Sarea resinae]